MPAISFRVNGYPAPYSSTTTRAWREAITEKAQEEREKIPFGTITPETYFTVSIAFEMTKPLRSDIDNLAKSVVDTLFLAPGNGKDPLPTSRQNNTTGTSPSPSRSCSTKTL